MHSLYYINVTLEYTLTPLKLNRKWKTSLDKKHLL